MPALYANNIDTTLAAAITPSATSITVTSAAGMPSPAGTPQFFWVTLQSGSGASAVREIVRCTARSGTTLTVVRAQQGTTATAFAAGDRVYVSWTASDAESVRGEPRAQPVYTGGRAVLWEHRNCATFGSSGIVAHHVIASLHHEEQLVQTYDAMMVGVSFPGAGALLALGLYAFDHDTRKITDLLWSTSGISAATSGGKTALFSAGTWTTAGAAYRDSSDRLRIVRGISVIKAVQWNGIGGITLHTISVTDCRGWINHSETGMYSGTQRPTVLVHTTATYPTLPSTFADPPSTSTITIPALALRIA